MRALITGAGGFVGQYLADYLASTTGWDLWGTIRSGVELGKSARAGETCPPLFDSPKTNAGLQQTTLDLNDYSATRALLGELRPNYIFHLAAQAFVGEAINNPETTLVNNLVGALHVLQAAKELDLAATVLMIGSGEEYGQVRPEDLPVNEATPFRPENPYAVSKIAQDMLALQYALAYKLRVVRVRPFNHIGPGQSPQFVTASFARQIARIEVGLAEPVVRVGNLNAERDFTDVRDMVRAYYLAVTEGEPGEVYNLGSGSAVSIQKILDTLLELSTAKVTVEIDPTRMRPADVPRIICDSSKFCQRTGWRPEAPLRRSLADILDYWRECVGAATPKS